MWALWLMHPVPRIMAIVFVAGIPEQLESDNEEVYWEIEKFIRLALNGVAPSGERTNLWRRSRLETRVHYAHGTPSPGGGPQVLFEPT